MRTPQLRLYHYWRSSSSWRVRWGFSIKGVECEYIGVNLLTGENDSATHTARNPMGYVPVLEIPGASGKPVYLSESLAILDWLESTHPSPSLYPRDPLKRAQALQLAEIINAGTQPLQNLNAQELHSKDPEARKEWARHWIENGLHAYEHWLHESAGEFSVGDSLTVADLCLIPQCYNATRNDVSLSQYPTVERIWKAASLTESYQKSCPDHFKPESA